MASLGKIENHRDKRFWGHAGHMQCNHRKGQRVPLVGTKTIFFLSGFCQHTVSHHPCLKGGHGKVTPGCSMFDCSFLQNSENVYSIQFEKLSKTSLKGTYSFKSYLFSFSNIHLRGHIP